MFQKSFQLFKDVGKRLKLLMILGLSKETSLQQPLKLLVKSLQVTSSNIAQFNGAVLISLGNNVRGRNGRPTFNDSGI